MKIPDSESVLLKLRNGEKVFCKGETEYHISSILNGLVQRGIFIGFFGKEDVYSDHDRPILFKVVDHARVVGAFEILKPSESAVVRKGLVVYGNKSDVFVCRPVLSVFGKKGIFDPEIRFLYEDAREITYKRKSFHAEHSNKQEYKDGKDARDNPFVAGHFFEIHKPSVLFCNNAVLVFCPPSVNPRLQEGCSGREPFAGLPYEIFYPFRDAFPDFSGCVVCFFESVGVQVFFCFFHKVSLAKGSENGLFRVFEDTVYLTEPFLFRGVFQRIDKRSVCSLYDVVLELGLKQSVYASGS